MNKNFENFMTKEQIEQCKREWASTEMSDLESGHLKAERLALYHKWFANLLAHARDVSVALREISK